MEEALFLEHGGLHPNVDLDLPQVAKANSKGASDIEVYKQRVLSEFRGDWPAFFTDWRSQQQEWQAKTTQELKEAKERYNTLYEQYIDVQKKLEAVHEESMRQKAAEEIKQARRLKRQSSKKQPLRATISITEFEGILSLIKGRSAIAKARRRLALAFLFLTGLRVSNLLVFSILNVKDLFSNGRTYIQLIKGGEARHKLVLTSKGRTFLKGFFLDYETLSVNKKGSDFLFSAPKNNEIPFNMELFDRELNSILAKASTLYEKHLRTHSFRATFITDLLESVPIDDVKEIIGHRSIATTLEYKRSRLTDLEKTSILKTRDSSLKKNKTES
jgi:site-specific recombinase XerD